MELIYLWVDGYKNLKNKGVLLNPNFTVDLDNSDSKNQKRIFLSEKKDSIKIFGNNFNIMTIVGKNGSGKSNIINALSAILRLMERGNSVFRPNVIYENYELPKDYCLIMQENNKYFACCSNPNDFLIKITSRAGKESKAKYLDIPHEPFVIEKRKIEQFRDIKINVAKFVPFFRGEETFYPEFSLWNGVFALTNIKIKNYFYYDRFRKYDAVRNLMKFYKFNDGQDADKKLKFFEDNQDLYFDSYTPYLNLYEGLQWVNDRIQNLKDENYDITQVISRSFSTFSSHAKKGRYKSVNDILKTLLPKLFFAYTVGEVLDIIDKQNISQDRLNSLKSLLRNFKQGRFPLSKERIDFYYNVKDIITTKRIKDMLQSYIDYEGNSIEESDIKNILRDNYEVVQSQNGDTGSILKLKNEVMFPFNETKELPSYITKIEALKGINKNLYKKDTEGNLYDYMSLSTGEQRILKFFADVYLVANLKKLNKNFDSAEVNVFLFDEMDLSWHPEWQRKMVYYIHDLFTKLSLKRIVNIIFTTHSPIILSDMPKENVVFLDKTAKDEDIQTFGANINDLFNNGMFLNCSNCMPMGEFVKQEINRIFTLLQDNNIKINQKEIETKINLIGEPMLRNSLLELLYTRVDYSHNDKINKILQEENNKLKIELQKYKEKNEKN